MGVRTKMTTQNTCLCVYQLKNGKLSSEKIDREVLYKHARKLDKICKSLNITPLSDFFETTYADSYLMQRGLPEKYKDFKEWIKAEGNWNDPQEGEAALSGLLTHLKGHKQRFGLWHDDYPHVVKELECAIGHIAGARKNAAKFALAVVV